MRDQVKAIAGLLEEKAAIPMVRDQMPLIKDVQTDEWWQDVTVPMLEVVRRRLRDLVKLIENRSASPFTLISKTRWVPKQASLCPASRGTDFAKFRVKAQVPPRPSGSHRSPQAPDEQGPDRD